MCVFVTSSHHPRMQFFIYQCAIQKGGLRGLTLKLERNKSLCKINLSWFLSFCQIWLLTNFINRHEISRNSFHEKKSKKLPYSLIRIPIRLRWTQILLSSVMLCVYKLIFNYFFKDIVVCPKFGHTVKR